MPAKKSSTTKTLEATIRMLPESTCPSSTGKPTLGYQVGVDDAGEIHLMITELLHCEKSPGNVAPADVYEGRRNDVPDQRALIKAGTLMKRKPDNLRLAGKAGATTGRKVSPGNRVRWSHIL